MIIENEVKTTDNWQVGTQVGLLFWPFCDGHIIEIQPRLVVGQMLVDQKYRVKWDNPKYGESGWLSSKDIIRLKDERNPNPQT